MSVLVEITVELALDEALRVDVVDLDWLEVGLIFDLLVGGLQHFDN